jgi:hypothetical protein
LLSGKGELQEKPQPLWTLGRVFFQVTAVLALAVAWCLLAVAAIVTASVRRFERAYLYLLATAAVVGLAIAVAIMLAP